MARLDRDSFARLIERHHAAVYRSALRVVRRPELAEDVTQEVFLRALRGKVDFAAAAAPGPVLCWLATRLGCNALRSGRRREVHEGRATEPAAMNEPSQLTADRELAQAVRRGVDELPDDLRLPLLLRYQDELTFAAVGSALQLSESAAHERVQRALGRLRARLAGSGLAALAPGIDPQQLDFAGLLGADPAAAPAHLHGRLLALADLPAGAGTAAAAGRLTAGKLAVAALAAGLCVAVAIVSRGDATTGPHAGDHLAAAADPARHEGDIGAPDAGRSRSPAAGAAAAALPPPQEPAPTHATFTGTVRDAALAPVAGARVLAVAAGGYKPFELAATTTSAGGAFELDVPFAGEPVPAKKIRIRVQQQDRVLLETAELAVAAGAAPLDLVLPRELGLESERCELVVAVLGVDGVPAGGVPVAFHARSGEAVRPLQGRADAEAVTDAMGGARLPLRKPGDGLLLVDGRKAGMQAVVESIRVGAPGEHRRTVRLVPGAVLRARIAHVDGTRLEWANVWLVDEANGLWHQAQLDADGTAAFVHLGPGPFTLHVQAHPHSPAARPGLRPGGDEVVIQLKRADDERDVGDHLAELHGRLVDAMTGEVVPFTDEMLDVRPVLDGASTLDADRVEPPRPVQRMVDDRRLERFHATGLDAGEWAVVATVPGYATAVLITALRARELRHDLELRLLRPARVEGRVLDGAGQPVADALVAFVGVGERADANLAAVADRLRGAPKGRQPALRRGPMHTDAEGRFALQDVPPSVALRVFAIVPGRDPAVSAGLVFEPGGHRSGIDLRLP